MQQLPGTLKPTLTLEGLCCGIHFKEKKIIKIWAGPMAQGVKSTAALSKGLSLVPSTCHSCLYTYVMLVKVGGDRHSSTIAGNIRRFKK